MCQNIGGPRYIVHVAACFCLVSPLDSQEEEEEGGDAKRVPVGHGRCFGSWPWKTRKSKEEKHGNAFFALQF